MIKTGCVLHQSNLLYKDLFQLEYFASTWKESSAIINFFRNHYKAQSWLEEAQKRVVGDAGLSAPMPAATRFGHRYIIWEWLFLNQYALLSTLCLCLRLLRLFLKIQKDIMGNEIWVI